MINSISEKIKMLGKILNTNYKFNLLKEYSSYYYIKKNLIILNILSNKIMATLKKIFCFLKILILLLKNY